MKTTLNRRGILRGGVAGLSAGIVAAFSGQAVGAATSAHPEVEIAGYEYDRIRAIANGSVGLPGANVSFHAEDIYTANQLAFGHEQRYPITEIGLIPYITKFVNEDFRDYLLIPIFISRTFRHRNIYVHTDSGIDTPEKLKGARVGVPGYGSSSNTWIRGFLLDEYDVAADQIQWIETTKSSDQGSMSGGGGFSAFRDGESPYFFPPDFPLVQGPPGVDESELLLTRQCDALITPITPKALLDGRPEIRQLFPDVRATEQAYFSKTGIFPIMHAVGIRKDIISANPKLPAAVFEMYVAAKQAAYADLESSTSLKVALPWAAQEFESTKALMGTDFWRYGIDANHKELERVMRYTHEQGLTRVRGEYRDMFEPSTMELKG